LVKYVRKSTLASDILEDENRLQSSNVTRWNSQLNMIKSVLCVEEAKLNQLNCDIKLSKYERNLCQELCMILEPFEKATLLLQKNISASITIPVTLGLKHQIKHISGIYSNKMISTFKSSMGKRMAQFESDESYTIASMLDPRFKIRWCVPDGIEKNTSLLKEAVCNIGNDDGDVTASPPMKKSKSDDFFNFLPTDTVRQRHVSGTSTEVDLYLHWEIENANMLVFCKYNR